MRSILRLSITLVLLALMAWPFSVAQAQYFGRNKVQYDNFDFKVFETEHFEIYFYDESEQAVKDVAMMAERWYQRHSRTFLREFHEKKPLIFYANDADFHQTNAISGSLGEGTGGVTESLKERVVMPLTGIYQETDHVLGHELVHSFQYDIGLSTSDSVRFALGAFPLWVIEGTAEYLSVGREDTHTAMWLRDAALNDDLPTAGQLTREPHKYFPYRYGQAYMAYIGGKYGDTAVTNLYKLGGRTGLDSAFVYVLGIKSDSLSQEWIQSVKDNYLPLTEGRVDAVDAGRRVLGDDIDSGKMNLAPAASPDGRYVAFISERDLFNINLFIANAETGEVIQRLKNGPFDSHFDNIRFISSAGSWSPDGKQFAFVVFADGDNQIQILDIDSGTVERRISVADVGAIMHTAWSPDGQTLAFTGIQGGISDLYLLDLPTNNVRKLTDDRYAAMQPAWSPDGRSLVFSTDRGPGGTYFETMSFGKMRMATIDIETAEIDVIVPFENAFHHNPQYSPDGQSIYFISDQDGFKDVYRYALLTEEIYRVTNLKTGVSGITKMSPAMSIAQQSGRMMFSVFDNGEYPVYSLEAEEVQGTLLSDTLLTEGLENRAIAAILPPQRDVDEGLVGSYLSDPLTGLPDNPDYDVQDYGARLRLDYVAPPTVGASVGGPFGAGVYGGVGFFFSDMLGNHNLTVVAQANGTVKDIGGQVSYMNRKNRLNFGAGAGHIPIVYGYVTQGVADIFDDNGNVVGRALTYDQIFQRIFIDQFSALGSYPFSTTRRLELGAGFVRYAQDIEVRRYVPTAFGFTEGQREDLDELEGDPIYFMQSSASFVGDNSSFGFTSPVRGGRFRLEAAPFLGTDNFFQITADFRKYFLMRPFTLAFRGTHIGNYGASEVENATSSFNTNIFTRQFLGYPNYPGFIRGYSFNSLNPGECTINEAGSCAETDRLFGTRMALASAELRTPLFGGGGYGLINFPYLPTEISLFFDAGLAWTENENFFDLLEFNTETTPNRIPVFSTGVSARFNLFGYMVVEAFYAIPFQRPEKGGHMGFQFVPGW